MGVWLRQNYPMTKYKFKNRKYVNNYSGSHWYDRELQRQRCKILQSLE
jgi:hypothetical protein